MDQLLGKMTIGEYLEIFGKVNPTLNNQIHFSSVIINIAKRVSGEYVEGLPEKQVGARSGKGGLLERHPRHSYETGLDVVHSPDLL